MVDEAGEPHILDFGLAKITRDEAVKAETAMEATVTGQIMGTLAYMSPEQASGQTSSIDVRSDVYSIGVVLYAILCGLFPYPVDGTPFEVLQNIKEAVPRRLGRVMEHCNSDVDAITQKCLSKEPERRYQSAAELQGDIERWLDGMPIAAKSDSSVYVLRKLIVRHRYTSSVAGLLIIIVMGFGLVSFSLYRNTLRARQEAEENRVQVTEQITQHLKFSEQITFSYALLAWRNGEWSDAASVSVFLPRDCKERKALAFLMDTRGLEEKEPEFRTQLGKDKGWFADFVVGEYYSQRGQIKPAQAAYERSYSGLAKLSEDEVPLWQKRQIAGRLETITEPQKGAEQ